MTPLFKRALWKGLLFVSPALYEKRRAASFGFAYPDYFDATQSIFIHVPKAAGTSVGMALYGRQIPHLSWCEWRQLNPRKFKRYFKFAVIRDPVTRFLSAFDYLKRGGMNDHDKNFANRVLKPFSNVNEFVKALLDPELQNDVLDWPHFRPQAEYVADSRGKPQIDLLLRFENLEVGFEEVARKLKTEVRQLPRLNVTPGQRTEALDPESLPVLECLYRKDFTLWQTNAV